MSWRNSTLFLDLLDKAIEAAKKSKPLDDAATATLKEMAANRGSIFIREEQQVATLDSKSWNAPIPTGRMPGRDARRRHPCTGNESLADHGPGSRWRPEAV